MKLRSRILSVVLTAALIVPMAFAAPQAAMAEDIDTETAIEDVLAELEEAPVMTSEAEASTFTADQIKSVYRGTTQVHYTSSIQNPGSTDITVTIPVKVRGGTYTTFEFLGDSNVSGVTAALYKDEGLTKEVSGFSTEQTGSSFDEDSKLYAAAIGGTTSDYYVYYVVLNLELANATTATTIRYCSSYYLPSKALSAGNWIYGTNMGSSKKSSFYKLTLKKSGYVDLSFSNIDSNNNAAFKFQICKAADGDSANTYFTGWETYSKAYGTVLGLQKGTYYVRVLTADDCYALKYTFSARSVTTNTTASKATELEVKDSANTLMPLNQNTATKATRYYKFTVPDTKTVKLTYKAYIDQGGSKTAGFKYALYKNAVKSANIVEIQGSTTVKSAGTGQHSGTIKITLKKGTYYFKAFTYGKGNGWFKLTLASMS